MKKMKKVFALLIAMVMVLGLSTSVFAASITITRDSSYEGTGDGRTYNYYKVFSANPGSGFSGTTNGGYDADGDPITEQGNGKVSYTATAAVAAKLADAGNQWFDVADIAGSTNKTISWKTSVDVTADNVQAAAAWLIANGAYESGPTPMTFSGTTWTSGNIDAGYYIVSSDTGNNLVAATTDIQINEKNDYPPIDKTQADEDAAAQTNDPVKVAIGDEITYQAKVTIPKTAKVGDKMVVVDTPSKGLTYTPNTVTIKENTGNATVDFTTPAVTTGQAWAATITVTDDSQGKDVIFEYKMVVNEDALIDTGRINTFDLKFGDKYTAIPETVEYKTYFAGIEKFDGDTTTTKLANVEFTLKEAGTEFAVIKDGEYYIPSTGQGASSTVVTDANGLIKIRGLDGNKTYTLTETNNPNPGYNMVEGDFTLTLYEDTGDAFANATADNWVDVPNYQGQVLPSTGGMGTTIFYIIGAILVIGAGVVLVTRRRMNK